MKKQNNKAKIVVSSVATIFLILLYILIFSFSEQDGEASGGLSRMISEKFVQIIDALANKNWSDVMIDSLARYFENPIRKLAHFCEYGLMAVLLFCIWYPWIERFKKCAIIIISWVFVSAFFDEMHQLFVPGRCGNFLDVLLDTSGGCTGLAMCILIVKYVNCRKKKTEKIKKKRSPKASFHK